MVDDYDYDARRLPDAPRLVNYLQGWTRVVNGREYSARTLRRLTWNNMGWRDGKKYGNLSREERLKVFRRRVEEWRKKRNTS